MEYIPDLEELEEDLEDAIYEQGIFNPSENAVISKLYRGMLTPFAPILELAEDTQRNMFVTTAFGDSLDRHANPLGVRRLTGTVPTGEVTFYLSNNKVASDITTDGRGIYIPANTMVYGGDVGFVVTDSVFISPSSNSVIASIAGTDINDVDIPSGGITTMAIDPATDIENISETSIGDESILVTNTEPIANGTYDETDDDYRNRIYYNNRSYNQNMEDYIRAKAYEVPEIVDVNFFKNTHGVGTVSVVPTTKNPETVRQTAVYLQSIIGGIGNDSIKVVVPDYLTVTVYNYIQLVDGTSNSTDVYATIKSEQMRYINNLTAGSHMKISELERIARDSSSNVVSCTVTCLKINERMVTIADQTAGWDEKFITVNDPNNSPIRFVANES